MASAALNPQNISSDLHGVQIYKDECMRCFACPTDEAGLNVCLQCFQGFCPGWHDAQHTEQTGHTVFVNIWKVPIETEEDLKAKKITKLAIGKEGGAGLQVEYNTFTRVLVLPSREEIAELPPWV